MKKIATLLLFVFTMSANAQSRHVVALRPTGEHPIVPQSIFLTTPHYVAPFSHNEILSTFDSLSYIDSVTNPLRYAFIPGFINFIQADKSRFSDTIMSYSEHFSPPFSAYLDRIEISVAFANLVQSSSDSINKNALTIRIKTTNTIGPKALDTAILSFSDLTALDPGPDANGGHPFIMLDIPMHHKKVNRSFFVEIAPALDFVNGLDQSNQNFLAIQHDSNFYTGNVPSAARSSMVALHGGSPTSNTPASFTYALIDPQGNNFYSNFYIVAYLTDQASGVEDTKLVGNALAQNYPNPFNPSTVIKYSLANEAKVSIKLYNALGLEVATILDANEPAGENQVTFSGDNLPSGTYFYTMKAGTFSQTKRMVLSK